MERVIEVRFLFGPWTRVSQESALKFARTVYGGMNAIADPAKKVALINERHVRGARFTVEDICQE